jgi:hypothetical protein
MKKIMRVIMIEIDIIKRFQTVRLYENRKISNSMWKNK